MIETIEGIVVERQPTHVVIENNGIGYGVIIPLSTYSKIPAVGSRIKLYTYMLVRDDSLNLFGFYTLEEKALLMPWLFVV
jgi:Holliday junction DNA helicase RuvA